MRIFDRQEWLRVNRARARIKVFVDKYGIDEFRTLVEEELKGDWVAERDFSLDGILFDARRGGARSGRARAATPARTATTASSSRFLAGKRPPPSARQGSRRSR